MRQLPAHEGTGGGGAWAVRDYSLSSRDQSRCRNVAAIMVYTRAGWLICKHSNRAANIWLKQLCKPLCVHVWTYMPKRAKLAATIQLEINVSFLLCSTYSCSHYICLKILNSILKDRNDISLTTKLQLRKHGVKKQKKLCSFVTFYSKESWQFNPKCYRGFYVFSFH